MKTAITTIGFLVTAALSIPAAGVAQDVTLGGQVRPRYEVRSQSGTETAFTSMRTRLQASAVLENDVRVFIQLQDVRLWGEETNTLGDFNADNLDLHQGWVEFSRPGETALAARVGRQEVNFGGQRLVGVVGWTQQARSFDGVRLSATTTSFHVDLLGAVLADLTAPGIGDDAWFVGAYSQLRQAGPGTLDLFALHNRVNLADTRQWTLGGRYAGTSGRITFRAEGAFQTGTRVGMDVAAYMVGARVGTAIGRGSLALWFDHLSGDGDLTDGETKVFDTLFATNHKFYGFADLFLNIPVHTGGRGLQDIALKGSVRPGPTTTLAVALHSFRLAQAPGTIAARLAEEADVVFTYRHSANSSFQVGIARVIGQAGLVDIGRNSDNMTWLYVMTNASF